MGKLTRGPGCGAAVVGFQRKSVLLLAAVVVFFGTHVGTHAHHLLVVHVQKSVLRQSVDEGGIAKLRSQTASGQVVRNLRHILHSARHDHVSLAKGNALGRKGHRLHARRTHFIHRGARNRVGQTSAKSGLARRSLTHVGLQHAAHHDFVNFLRVKVDFGKRTANGGSAELGCGHAAEGAHKASDRGPHGRHNNYVFHHQKVVMRRYYSAMLNHLGNVYLQPFSQGLTTLEINPGEVGERLKPVVC